MMSEEPPVANPVAEEAPVVRPAHRPPRFTRKDLLWLALLVLVAFGVRAWRIDYPDREYFDEIYYVDAAQKMMEGKEDPNNVHPPLGKLQLGLGIRFVEALRAQGVPLNKEVGWRLGSLVLGTLIIPLTFYLGWILPGGGRFVAFAAAALVSLDFMHLVQCRIAMLDMYQAFWIMLGLVAAWKYLEAGPRCWLWAAAAALCLGAATACKWSGLFAAVGAYLAMTLLWPGGFRFGRAVGMGMLFAVLISAVYIQSYTPLFIREHALGLKQLKTIVGYHERMWKFRYDEKQFNHRYLSPWFSWPAVYKPVWYVYEETPKTRAGEPEPPASETTVHGIVTIGNPLFWWTFLLFLAEATMLAIVRKDRARGFLVLAYYPQWLLWASATTGGFIYYMLPEIPLMAIITAMSLSDWRDSVFWKRSLIVYFGLILVAFLVFFPLLTGLPVVETYFRSLFFFNSWI